MDVKLDSSGLLPRQAHSDDDDDEEEKYLEMDEFERYGKVTFTCITFQTHTRKKKERLERILQRLLRRPFALPVITLVVFLNV